MANGPANYTWDDVHSLARARAVEILGKTKSTQIKLYGISVGGMLAAQAIQFELEKYRGMRAVMVDDPALADWWVADRMGSGDEDYRKPVIILAHPLSTHVFPWEWD